MGFQKPYVPSSLACRRTRVFNAIKNDFHLVYLKKVLQIEKQNISLRSLLKKQSLKQIYVIEFGKN